MQCAMPDAKKIASTGASLRRLAINILRTHPDRASIRRKIKRTGWDEAVLLSMLGQMR